MINGVAPYSLATSKTLHHALFDAVGAAAPPFVALRRGADGMAAPETAARAAARAAGLRYPLLLKARGRGARRRSPRGLVVVDESTSPF